MKIRFTIQLSPATVRAFELMEECSDGHDIKDAIVAHLTEWLDELRSDAAEHGE